MYFHFLRFGDVSQLEAFRKCRQKDPASCLQLPLLFLYMSERRLKDPLCLLGSEILETTVHYLTFRLSNHAITRGG